MKLFLRKLFYVSSQWTIGLINQYSDSDILTEKIHDVKWIQPKNSRAFYADPFLTEYFGEPMVFIEEWIPDKNKGIISYICLNELQPNTNIQNSHEALKLPTHLSYPYLFEYNNQLYMVPENYQSGTITLYEAGSTPDKWMKKSVLIDDFPGIDTTIFEWNNLWWMFSTRFDWSNKSDNRNELYIWYSDTPLSGWKMHPKSPMHYKEPIARAAGAPFSDNNQLFRPTQDCRTGYGKQLLINKIITLTTDEFQETVVKEIQPIAPYTEALHTYSSCQCISVIDGIHGKYSVMKPINYLRKKFNK